MQVDIILSSLGWALLHSVWQGFLAAGVVYAMRRIVKSSQASLRYSLQFMCLVACLAAFVATFGFYAAAGISGAPAQTITTSITEIIQLSKLTFAPAVSEPAAFNYNEILHNSAPLLGALWVMGFVIVSVRCTIAYKMTQTLRKKGLSPAPKEWALRFKMLARQAGLPRMAEIYISNRVSGPLTLGFFKPIVLVPASFFTQLPADQVEAVLLHELAHIRRHDYVLNIVQTAIKAVLFYHPGVHYISRRINDDREYACDDFSARETKNPKALVKALAALRVSQPKNSFAMAAGGSNSPLLDRLQRLVKTGSAKPRRERGQGTVPAIALLLSTAIYFSVAPLSEAHPDPNAKDTYNHAKNKLENYSFDVIQHDGKPVTVKVTEDGRQWILVDGAWYDVEKRPDMIRAVPAMPAPPLPPVPPVNFTDANDKAAVKKFEKAMRKFEKNMDQFEIDMDYYGKSMENWGQKFGQNFMDNGGAAWAENFGQEFTQNFEAEFGDRFSGEFAENFADNFADNFSENFSNSFAGLGEDLEDSDHPDNMDDARKKADQMRERMLARAEEQREKAEEARDRMEEDNERREEQRERMEERREAAMERAQEQREKAQERAEEMRERAMERAEEQRERAMERAERSREKAERQREHSHEKREKYTQLRTELFSNLKEDGVIGSDDDSFTMQYKDGSWVVDGTKISKSKKEKYCDIVSNAGISKNGTTISLSPGSTLITTQSGKNNTSTTISHGKYDFDNPPKHHTHKDGSTHDDKSWKEGSNLNFIHPVTGAKMHLRFNEKVHSSHHQGVDLGIHKGTPVVASASGHISKISTTHSWGKRIFIEHDNGFSTVYANLDSFNVKEGQKIKAGDMIGTVGNTADVTVKPHLHFEIRHDGKLVDPEAIISNLS